MIYTFAAQSYQLKALVEYDNILLSIMGEVTSMTVASDDKAWTQASLPLKFVGLGV